MCCGIIVEARKALRATFFVSQYILMLSTLATRTTHSPIRTYAIFYCVAPDYMHFWTYISHLRGWLLQNILKEPRNRLVHGTRRKWRATKSSIREERRMANKTKQERSYLMATSESSAFGRASYAARKEVGCRQRPSYELELELIQPILHKSQCCGLKWGHVDSRNRQAQRKGNKVSS